MDATDWDARYSEHDEQMWSGRPNGALVTETAGLPPGRALDVGCGEGADAIWLAGRGWRVTGLDVSQVALDRGEAVALREGVQVDWVCADLAAARLPPGGYDLVSLQYPALPSASAEESIGALLDAVAPGGTLVVVGHTDVDSELARSHGVDPADYVQPDDVVARLRTGWDVEMLEERERDAPPGVSSHHRRDLVLRARRNG
jgi:SAM-dependent methyltransferase